MKNQTLKSFTNPGAIYRGAPFWSWNNKLDKDQLLRQIGYFKEMGIGGFHIHPRTGLDTEYLGEEFMSMVKACRDKAEEEGMLAWLYDEDRWPSGAAGGIVTQEESFRARHLLFTPTPYSQTSGTDTTHSDSSACGGRYENGELIASYEINLTDGTLTSYRRLGEGESAAPGTTTWYAYLEVARPSSWFNDQTYVDTMSPDAMKRFIEVTHEAYYKEVGESFGTTVPAIFTDEPQFVHKQSLNQAAEQRDIIMPWTPDLPQTFAAAYDGDLLAHLPEIFWELPEEKASIWRYRFHDHVCERFTQAFSDQIGDWCEDHNIALTGHMMEENTLRSQTNALGESMRGYRSFQIPGIDVLCDAVEGEYSTAKQAQSAAHQYGRSGVLSELYGVTNWDFDFAGHKRQGDWQAALGITYRVHHLSWVSMAGEAKRDYPASINYQSPWYKEYPVVEDHFARVNLALTEGKPQVRIGVIHPIESYWLACGPKEQTEVERGERDTNFRNIILWLLYGLQDFDFISESLLPEQKNEPSHNGFAVGEMEYEVIVVPGLRTIRSTTLTRLEAFADAGGKVVFAGEIPTLVDVLPSSAPAELAARCEAVPYAGTRILTALEPVREISLTNFQGVPVTGCLHQLRTDGDTRTLFLCNTNRDKGLKHLSLKINGAWAVTHLDTAAGTSSAVGASYGDDTTCLTIDLPAHGSLLFSLSPGKQEEGKSLTEAPKTRLTTLKGPVPVTLEEPNVLLLDGAEYRIGEGEWQPKRHLLDLDPIVRGELGLPTVEGQMAQPWTDSEPVVHAAYVSLRFTFESRVDVAKPSLALEGAANTRILVDGMEVEKKINGYFTDEAIERVELPPFTAGTHSLELIIDYTRKTYIEWCYLLGDFGVEVRGAEAVIIEPVRELAFGDWVHQGLPFYAGNLTYHCTLPVGGKGLSVRTPHFAGPLVKVEKGDLSAPLAYAPYRAELGDAIEGEKVDITVFGNRVNSFGSVHNTIAKGNFWYGPNVWRSKDDRWADEYQLCTMGLLTAPVVEGPA